VTFVTIKAVPHARRATRRTRLIRRAYFRLIIQSAARAAARGGERARPRRAGGKIDGGALSRGYREFMQARIVRLVVTAAT